VPDLDILYAAYSGYAGVDATLHLFEDGSAQAQLMTSASLPHGGLDQVGTFHLAADSERAAEAESLVDAAQLDSRKPPAGVGSPDATERTLRVSRGKKETVVGIGPAPGGSSVDALERYLVGVLEEASRHPERAVKVTTSGIRHGESADLEIGLSSVGTDPASVVFFDPDDPGLWIRVTLFGRSVSGTGTPVSLTREQIGEAVDVGDIPPGVLDWAAGETGRLVVPGVALPPGTAPVSLTTTAQFWFAGPGLARRAATVTSELTLN
jgi:hypothetical protein